MRLEGLTTRCHYDVAAVFDQTRHGVELERKLNIWAESSCEASATIRWKTVRIKSAVFQHSSGVSIRSWYTKEPVKLMRRQ